MGNKNNKPKFTLPPTIDKLPVEIIYKILDELDICTIFSSLHHVCKRFDEILLTYHRYHLNFENLSMKKLNFIYSRIHPERVTELTLSDDENRSGLIQLFLSKFPLGTFVHLHSLTLMQINNEEFVNNILIPIADRHALLNLSSLKILNSDENYAEVFLDVLMSVLTKPSLREVHLELSYGRTTSNPLPWHEECSIQHLKFTGTATVNFIRDTLIYLPQLETLKIDDLDFSEEIDLNYVPTNQNDDNNEEEEDNVWFVSENQLTKKEQFTSIKSPGCLKSLVMNACTMNMSKLEWILEDMPTLKHLRLFTSNLYDDPSILDGQRWENHLQNIDKFEFVFALNIPTVSQWDTDTCIMKFQTPFWMEEKQWFVTLEKYDDEIILYTLPYRDNIFLIRNRSSPLEYRSTVNEDSKLKLQTMNSVRDLYIDTSTMKVSQFENIVSPRFTRVTKLNLYGKWSKSKTVFSDLQAIVSLNTIEELIREECIPTIDFLTLLNLMPNLQSIKTTTTLLDALNAAKFSYKNCLRSFVIGSNSDIEQRPIHIEPFCDMFPRIQNLVIPVDSVDSCRYAIEQLNQDLISVIFRIPDDDDSSSIESCNGDEEENSIPYIYSEWMTNELPKQYHCHKNQQQIHIWLK